MLEAIFDGVFNVIYFWVKKLYGKRKRVEGVGTGLVNEVGGFDSSNLAYHFVR